MPRINLVIESKVSRSPRARQLEGMFDVPAQDNQRMDWSGNVPIEDKDWNVGLIVGPSGCGKTSVARHMFGDSVDKPLSWGGAGVIDDFDKTKGIEDISAICQAVGFNTIPAWLRPYEVLSNGEKFRVQIARRLLEQADPIVVDEFTSVIDRQVAKIGSHAVQKYVRKHNRKFVAVACHYDIIDWLQPDWVLEPATMTFNWRLLRRRPEISVEICRVPYGAWRVFAPYHYMTADLNKAASCFCLFADGKPAALGAMLYRPHPKVKNIWGLSRLVTLPDFQGLGLAFVLTDHLGAAYAALERKMNTYPAHPALIRSFDRSSKWRLQRRPGMLSKRSTAKVRGEGGFAFGGRPCAVFQYAGPAMEDLSAAKALVGR